MSRTPPPYARALDALAAGCIARDGGGNPRCNTEFLH